MPTLTTYPPEDPSNIRLMKMVTAFGQGGTEGQVNSLLKGLERSCFSPRIACLNKWGHHLREIEALGIPVTEFPLNSLYKPHTFRQILKLAAHMRTHRTQILHSYNFYSNVVSIPAARLAGVPVVFASIRDQGVYLSPLQRRLHKWVGRLADKVLVNADSIGDWLIQEGFQAEKIVTIRNGLDIGEFMRTKTGSGIRREYGIAPETPLVMMLSRLNPHKGIDDYLKAAALVSRRHPQARFLVIGEKLQTNKGVISTDTSYHANLRQLADDLGLSGKVFFTGRRFDVASIMAEAAVSVLPSYSEGIPNSLMESMAAGVPVVATQIGGIPELIEHGESGFLVPAKSPEALAARIETLLKDKALACRFSRAGKQVIQKHFSMEAMIKDTQNLYISQLVTKVPSLRDFLTCAY